MTKMGQKRTIPKVSWLSKTRIAKRKEFEKPTRNILKRSKGLNKMSDKAKAELKVWMKVKSERIKAIIAKYKYVHCERCGTYLWSEDIISAKEAIITFDGHHNDWNRRNNTFDNCRIVCRFCHTTIHDHNIKDVPSLL